MTRDVMVRQVVLRPEGTPLVDCISEIVTTYLNATNLVERIKRSNKRPLSEDALVGLEISLALGPPIVQGQYDCGVKRIGQQYVYGDETSQEEMKSILINLQATLRVGLQQAFMDNLELDYGSFQTSSDGGRVDSILCLGRLGERLAPGVQMSRGLNSASLPPGTVEMPANGDLTDQEFSPLSTAGSVFSRVASSHTATTLSLRMKSESLSTAGKVVSPISTERSFGVFGHRNSPHYLPKVTVELPTNKSEALDGIWRLPSLTAPQALGPRSFPTERRPLGFEQDPPEAQYDSQNNQRSTYDAAILSTIEYALPSSHLDSASTVKPPLLPELGRSPSPPRLAILVKPTKRTEDSAFYRQGWKNIQRRRKSHTSRSTAVENLLGGLFWKPTNYNFGGPMTTSSDSFSHASSYARAHEKFYRPRTGGHETIDASTALPSIRSWSLYLGIWMRVWSTCGPNSGVKIRRHRVVQEQEWLNWIKRLPRKLAHD
ncbi:conserved hypothetical protein [Histoplasma capsulatum H143]|uniref:Uncharacterized protein n=1 Tax=Ajellomyces capsulatus (strain H143) TaxID=544712 RepID=C6H1F2_AJECH|nr:conserved hypothetical protein [Histoplasma capsulatum H143]